MLPKNANIVILSEKLCAIRCLSRSDYVQNLNSIDFPPDMCIDTAVYVQRMSVCINEWKVKTSVNIYYEKVRLNEIKCTNTVCIYDGLSRSDRGTTALCAGILCVHV